MEKTLQIIRKYKKNKLKELGLDLTNEQWDIIRTIYDHPGILQKQLADLVLKDPAAIKRTLDLLENSAFIERRASRKDKRGHRLFLTEMGAEIIHKMVPISIDFNAKGTRGLSAEEMEELYRILQHIQHNFSK